MGRIHLDTVERLGEFLELEVVLRAGQTIAIGEDVARGLMEWLGIAGEDLLRYPKAEACREAVTAVSDWPASHELPRVVTFCCFGSEEAQRYRSRLADVVPSGRFA